MLERVALDDGGAQVGPALEDDLPAAFAVERGHVHGTRGLESLVNCGIDVVGHLRIGEARKSSIGTVWALRPHRAKPLGQRICNRFPVPWHNHRGRVDT